MIDLGQKMACNVVNRGHLEHFLRRPAKSGSRGKPEGGSQGPAGGRFRVDFGFGARPFVKNPCVFNGLGTVKSVILLILQWFFN